MGSFNSKVASKKNQRAIRAWRANAKNVRETKEHGRSVGNEEKCPKSDDDGCVPSRNSKTPERMSPTDKLRRQSRNVKRTSNVPE